MVIECVHCRFQFMKYSRSRLSIFMSWILKFYRIYMLWLSLNFQKRKHTGDEDLDDVQRQKKNKVMY